MSQIADKNVTCYDRNVTCLDKNVTRRDKNVRSLWIISVESPTRWHKLSLASL